MSLMGMGARMVEGEEDWKVTGFKDTTVIRQHYESITKAKEHHHLCHLEDDLPVPTVDSTISAATSLQFYPMRTL